MKSPEQFLEIETAAGVEELALAELFQGLSPSLKKKLNPERPGPGIIQIAPEIEPRALLDLQIATAVYWVERFAIPRPKALLGDQHFRRLLGSIRQVFGLSGRERFQTLYLSAAGRDSKILTRLKNELARATGLEIGVDDGDLLLRLRRATDRSGVWELLVRTTPRPLSARTWRVCNYPGALNAPMAAAMVALSAPKGEDEILNIGCGSATIMIERVTWGPARWVLGCDINDRALDCAARNLSAAGLDHRMIVFQGEGRKLPFNRHRFDALFADLPFGSLVGSHVDNETLYPALLAEGGRVTKPGGCFIVITHEVRLMESILRVQQTWQLEKHLRVSLRGLHPRIYRLRKS